MVKLCECNMKILIDNPIPTRSTFNMNTRGGNDLVLNNYNTFTFLFLTL